jgi:hypothetical protein
MSRFFQENKLTYFIGGESGPVKVGQSTNVHLRLESLQTGHYQKLSILATTEQPEKELHLILDSYNARVRGEWFDRSRCMTMIRSLQKNPKNVFKLDPKIVSQIIDDLKEDVEKKWEIVERSGKFGTIEDEEYKDARQKLKDAAFKYKVPHEWWLNNWEEPLEEPEESQIIDCWVLSYGELSADSLKFISEEQHQAEKEYKRLKKLAQCSSVTMNECVLVPKSVWYGLFK